MTVRTRITSPQQHDDKYMAAALAAVEDRAKPFRNALDDGCLLPVETAEFKPRYSMLDPKDRQALWAPNFQEAAFEFYSFVPQIDIVATWRNNPKCRAYMVQQASPPPQNLNSGIERS